MAQLAPDLPMFCPLCTTEGQLHVVLKSPESLYRKEREKRGRETEREEGREIKGGRAALPERTKQSLDPNPISNEGLGCEKGRLNECLSHLLETACKKFAEASFESSPPNVTSTVNLLLDRLTASLRLIKGKPHQPPVWHKEVA